MFFGEYKEIFEKSEGLIDKVFLVVRLIECGQPPLHGRIHGPPHRTHLPAGTGLGLAEN